MRKRIVIIVGVLIVLGLIFYMIKGSDMEIEVARVERGPVSEFISEDGKTRLSRKYTINMPVEGRLLRMGLEVDDYVEKGRVVAGIDPYQMRQKLAGLKAQLDEIAAQIIGVDQAKPKPEDIEAARLRVDASRLRLENAPSGRKRPAGYRHEKRGPAPRGDHPGESLTCFKFRASRASFNLYLITRASMSAIWRLVKASVKSHC